MYHSSTTALISSTAYFMSLSSIYHLSSQMSLSTMDVTYHVKMTVTVKASMKTVFTGH